MSETYGSAAYERVIDAARNIGKTVIERGDRASIQCPAHDDRSPSLSVGPRRDRTGVVIACHAGCDYVSVLDALGLAPRDLFNEPRTRQDRPFFKPPGNFGLAKTKLDDREDLRALADRFGSLAAAGKARTETHDDPHCAHCRSNDRLGGPHWFGRFCSACATGWASDTDIAEQQRWNAGKQAAEAISQTRDWKKVAQRAGSRK